MYCTLCGAKIKKDAMFCTKCGQSAVISDSDMYANMALDNAEIFGDIFASAEITKNKKMTDLILSVAIFICIVLVICSALFFSQKIDKKEAEKLPAESVEAVGNEEYDDGLYQDESGKSGDSEQSIELEQTDIGDANNTSVESEQSVVENQQEPLLGQENNGITGQDYILPGSDSRYLTMADLQGLNAEECRLARNELYARHGRKFQDEALQEYFSSKSWYHGTIDPDRFSEKSLNDYEEANRDLIVEYEKKKGYR